MQTRRHKYKSHPSHSDRNSSNQTLTILKSSTNPPTSRAQNMTSQTMNSQNLTSQNTNPQNANPFNINSLNTTTKSTQPQPLPLPSLPESNPTNPPPDRSSILPQTPWTVPPNHYVRTDGTVIYVQGEHHFWFSGAADGAKAPRKEESVECQAGRDGEERGE
jgi:hypothetical protein